VLKKKQKEKKKTQKKKKKKKKKNWIGGKIKPGKGGVKEVCLGLKSGVRREQNKRMRKRGKKEGNME